MRGPDPESGRSLRPVSEEAKGKHHVAGGGLGRSAEGRVARGEEGERGRGLERQKRLGGRAGEERKEEEEEKEEVAELWPFVA
jgi:hypothetical protein